MRPTCKEIGRNPKDYAGGQTFMRITENNFTNIDKPSYGLLSKFCPLQFEQGL